MRYRKPSPKELTSTHWGCDYGCGNKAKYEFDNGKFCCSIHYNSCPGKIKKFSDLDHTTRTIKSLETRTRLGITKSSQIKGGATRRSAGHYEKLAITMQGRWEKNPWNNQEPRGAWLLYKDTEIGYQGSYEYNFLQDLESTNGLQWLIDNVKRGPAIWYIDSLSRKKRLYISDFIINNTIYEVKSSYTWNRNNKDKSLETLNRCKLDECIAQGYSVVLMLDKKEIKYEKSVD